MFKYITHVSLRNKIHDLRKKIQCEKRLVIIVCCYILYSICRIVTHLYGELLGQKMSEKGECFTLTAFKN